MSETELKLVVDPTCSPAIDSALRGLAAKTRTIESRYFDTADRRLANASLSLRLRRSGRSWEQTLKGPGSHAAEREEETIARPGKWSPEGPAIDPVLHASTRTGRQLLTLLDAGHGATTALRSSYASVIVRRSATIGVGNARVTIAFDRGALRAGMASQAICEVEYELESGPPAALVRLARAGVIAHAMCLSSVAKATRGDRLARGEFEAPSVQARPPVLDVSMSGSAVLRAVLRSCLDQILGNASEIAIGEVSDGLVHELRVGLRRLRTATRELAQLDPSLNPMWEASLSAAFRLLGAYRDRTAVAAAIQARLSAAGSPAPTIPLVPGDAPDPVAVVRDKAFQCALLDILAALVEPAHGGDDGQMNRDSATVATHIAARLDKLHRCLLSGARGFSGTGETEQHRVRKRLKRLRYVAELVAPLYRAADLRRYVAKLKTAQDELGVYFDLVVSARLADRGLVAVFLAHFRRASRASTASLVSTSVSRRRMS